MLFHLFLAKCSIDPFVLRDFSHIFSVCSVLLLSLGAIIFFLLLQEWIVKNFYHWLFTGATLLSSILAYYLAIKSNRDLLVCSFGLPTPFLTFRVLVVLMSGITLLLLLIGSRIIGLGTRRS